MTNVKTEMAVTPSEEKNWEEQNQIQLYMARLCRGNISQSRKLSLQQKERKAGEEAGENVKWLLMFLLEGAELSRHRKAGLFLSLMPLR